MIHDRNGDGAYDPSTDEQLAGVALDVSNGAVDRSVTTDSNGYYSQDLAQAGQWTVTIDTSTLGNNSFRPRGANPTTVSPKCGVTTLVDAFYLPSYLTGRLYEVSSKSCALGGTIFEDKNDNQRFDAGFDAYLEGVTVLLSSGDAGLEYSTVTDAAGRYRQEVPAGKWVITIVTSTLGNDQLEQTLGSNPTAVEVCAASESNLAGVSVIVRSVPDLTSGSGSSAPTTVVLTTDSNGSYAQEVTPGNWTVAIQTSILSQSGLVQTLGNNPTRVFVPYGGVGSDQDGFLRPQIDEAVNIDAFALPSYLEGVVFHDVAGNGAYDPGFDRYLVGVSVTASRGTTTLETATDVSGFYQFRVAPGDWTVSIDTGTLGNSQFRQVMATHPRVGSLGSGTNPTTVQVPYGSSGSDVKGYTLAPPREDPPAPPLATAGRDPHLIFAHGGRADFRGRDGAYYSVFSAPGLALNIRTEQATFRIGSVTVDGSFITETHLVARVGPRRNRLATASFWARELNKENWGWRVINGTCAGRAFRFGARGSKRCFDFALAMGHSSATFTLRNWSFSVHGNHVYDRISGPQHRLDIGFSAKGDAAARSLPHGLVGQSYSSMMPRHGAVDEYPSMGHFKTSSMAEGAIEGVGAQYELGAPYETRFAFSRFDEADALRVSAARE